MRLLVPPCGYPCKSPAPAYLTPNRSLFDFTVEGATHRLPFMGLSIDDASQRCMDPHTHEPPRFLHAWERNIDNAYWNLDKRKVADAVRKAADTVGAHHRIHNTFTFFVVKLKVACAY